jgi:hypothetical protein
MATPFQVNGTLLLPGAPSLPQDPIPFGIVAQYDHKSEQTLICSGTGSKTVSFGTIPNSGAKCLVLVFEPASLPAGSPAQAPITVTLNGGAAIEVAPGGFVAFGSPAPTAGLISLAIGHTGAATVHVWVLA